MSPEKKIRLDSVFESDNTQLNKAVLEVTECSYFGKETSVIVHPSSCPENVTVEKNEATIADRLLEIERNLATKITSMVFQGPVSYVYNPIDYAYNVHSKFVYKFCNSEKTVMFLGMNPGPWGMSQTGVPFGEVNIVRDWMGINGDVGRPERENPSRPVMGFACKRSEVSGQRFWGLFKDLCGDPSNFFQDVTVYNYCPVAFMTDSGKNITPSELKISEREALNTLCDEALYKVLQLLNTNIIVAIGKFCEKRAASLLKSRGLDHIRSKKFWYRKLESVDYEETYRLGLDEILHSDTRMSLKPASLENLSYRLNIKEQYKYKLPLQWAGQKETRAPGKK